MAHQVDMIHVPLKAITVNSKACHKIYKELQTTNQLNEGNILHTAYNNTSILFTPINKSKQINKNSKPSQTQGL